MQAFLQDWLGPSWRSSLLGLLLMLLGTLGIGVGLLLTLMAVTKAVGLQFIGLGGTMVVTGIGFLMTRDQAASEQAHTADREALKADVKTEVHEALKR